MNDIEDFTKQNIILAVLHLKEASGLLKIPNDQISILLLELSLKLMETYKVTQQEVNNIEQLKKSLENEQQQ